MKNPISIQFLMVTKTVAKGYTMLFREHFENAKSIVVLSNEGILGSYPIENREYESESVFVDLLFTEMNVLKNEQHLFKEPTKVFLETECGELIKIDHLVECSIVEVAEHTEFETILYDPTTLTPLEEE